MEKLGGLVVRASGIYGAVEQSQASRPPVCCYPGLPLAALDVVTNALVARRIAARPALVELVFAATGQPQIGAPVVQAVAVDVVYASAGYVQAHPLGDESVHPDSCPEFTPGSVMSPGASAVGLVAPREVC